MTCQIERVGHRAWHPLIIVSSPYLVAVRAVSAFAIPDEEQSRNNKGTISIAKDCIAVFKPHKQMD